MLGPLDGRFGFTLRDGAVVAIVEGMSNPWLQDGWSRSLAGEEVAGYGFWGDKRPTWEPRTYETFAAALALLGPRPADDHVRLAAVLTAMQPIARRLGLQRREDLRYRSWRDTREGADEFQILVDCPADGRLKAWVRVGYRAVPRRTP